MQSLKLKPILAYYSRAQQICFGSRSRMIFFSFQCFNVLAECLCPVLDVFLPLLEYLISAFFNSDGSLPASFVLLSPTAKLPSFLPLTVVISTPFCIFNPLCCSSQYCLQVPLFQLLKSSMTFTARSFVPVFGEIGTLPT